MSFSSNLKEEIASIYCSNCCLKAELYSIIKYKANIKLSSFGVGLEIVTTLNATVRRIVYLFKKVYNLNLEIAKLKKDKLDYKDRFVITINKDALIFLNDLKILNQDYTLSDDINYEILKKDCCKFSLLRGLFLVQGSVNDPCVNNYHLELVLDDSEFTSFIKKILEDIGITPKFINRSKGLILYLKKAEEISDFLKLIGAFNCLFQFEDLRIKKDYNNNVNRVINCDIANEEKAIKSAAKQLENIEFLLKKKKSFEFTQRLLNAMELRKTYPDSSLSELSELSFDLTGKYISKSGLSHCFKDIEKMCRELNKE